MPLSEKNLRCCRACPAHRHAAHPHGIGAHGAPYALMILRTGLAVIFYRPGQWLAGHSRQLVHGCCELP